MSGPRHCPIVDHVIEHGDCFDVGAHAFRFADFTEDRWLTELLGDRRLDRDALGRWCEVCPHNGFRP